MIQMQDVMSKPMPDFREGSIIKGQILEVRPREVLVDVVPPKDLPQFVGNTYDFKIVKLNDERKNVVLSRREVIEQERSEKRQKFLESVNVGDRVVGTVKNITDFGAFIDLDGMDGLLH